MDTGNIMQNQMSDLIDQGIALKDELNLQSQQLYKNHKLLPLELLYRYNEAIEVLKEIVGSIDSGIVEFARDDEGNDNHILQMMDSILEKAKQ